MKNQNPLPHAASKSYGRLMLAAVLAALATTGCTTMIPETDTTPPNLQITITGPGIGRAVTDQAVSDHLQWNVLMNARYHLSVTVSDAGGSQFLGWRVPDIFHFVSAPVGGGGVGSVTEVPFGPIQKVFQYFGSRSAPTSGLLLAGNFTISEKNNGFDCELIGADFGGRTGASNRRSLIIHLLSVDRDPGVIPTP